jgi:hypothetical protein
LTAERPFCDPGSLRCVPCMEDGHCPAEASFCLSEAGEPTRCVQCREVGSSEDCEPGLVCNAQNFCAPCGTDADCPVERPICSLDSRACVACDDDAGLSCPRERPICHLGQCLGCQFDSDCGSVLKCDPKMKRCELCLTHEHCQVVYGDSRPFCSGGTCHECRTASDCSEQFPVCTSGGTCVQCTPKVPCSDGSFCDRNGQCVDCMVDFDCPLALPHCVAGRCSQCKDDSQCPVGACMDGVCKECDGSTMQYCTTVAQKQYQTCSNQLTCESNVP